MTSNIRSIRYIFSPHFSISKVAQGASRAGEVAMRHKNHLEGKLGPLNAMVLSVFFFLITFLHVFVLLENFYCLLAWICDTDPNKVLHIQLAVSILAC